MKGGKQKRLRMTRNSTLHTYPWLLHEARQIRFLPRLCFAALAGLSSHLLCEHWRHWRSSREGEGKRGGCGWAWVGQERREGRKESLAGLKWTRTSRSLIVILCCGVEFSFEQTVSSQFTFSLLLCWVYWKRSGLCSKITASRQLPPQAGCVAADFPTFILLLLFTV